MRELALFKHVGEPKAYETLEVDQMDAIRQFYCIAFEKDPPDMLGIVQEGDKFYARYHPSQDNYTLSNAVVTLRDGKSLLRFGAMEIIQRICSYQADRLGRQIFKSGYLDEPIQLLLEFIKKETIALVSSQINEATLAIINQWINFFNLIIQSGLFLPTHPICREEKHEGKTFYGLILNIRELYLTQFKEKVVHRLASISAREMAAAIISDLTQNVQGLWLYLTYALRSGKRPLPKDITLHTVESKYKKKLGKSYSGQCALAAAACITKPPRGYARNFSPQVFSYFGISPQVACQRLKHFLTVSDNSHSQMRQLLESEFKKLLVDDEGFVNHLKTIHLIDREENKEAVTTPAKLEEYAGNNKFLEAMISYGVPGSAFVSQHGATLLVLAHTLKIELHLWKLGSSQMLTPYSGDGDVFKDVAPETVARRLDLLFDNNRVWRLSFEGYDIEKIGEYGPIYPLERNPFVSEQGQSRKIYLPFSSPGSPLRSPTLLCEVKPSGLAPYFCSDKLEAKLIREHFINLYAFNIQLFQLGKIGQTIFELAGLGGDVLIWGAREEVRFFLFSLETLLQRIRSSLEILNSHAGNYFASLFESNSGNEASSWRANFRYSWIFRDALFKDIESLTHKIGEFSGYLEKLRGDELQKKMQQNYERLKIQVRKCTTQVLSLVNDQAALNTTWMTRKTIKQHEEALVSLPTHEETIPKDDKTQSAPALTAAQAAGSSAETTVMPREIRAGGTAPIPSALFANPRRVTRPGDDHKDSDSPLPHIRRKKSGCECQ